MPSHLWAGGLTFQHCGEGKPIFLKEEYLNAKRHWICFRTDRIIIPAHERNNGRCGRDPHMDRHCDLEQIGRYLGCPERDQGQGLENLAHAAKGTLLLFFAISVG